MPVNDIDVNHRLRFDRSLVVLDGTELLSIAAKERKLGDPAKFADWVSDAAQAVWREAGQAPPVGADIAALRVHYDAFNRRMLDLALESYEVECLETTSGGTPTHIVVPRDGVRNDRVLLCLHGGAFMWGSGAGELLEAVPVACETGSRVVALDYRLAPEHPYPAAVDDVLSAYRELLDQAPAAKIAIYGCSAGGMLTAQAVARIVAEGLPPPGAVAMLHGTGLDFAGDAATTSAILNGLEGTDSAPSVRSMPYFAEADLTDPLVLPGIDPQTLAAFPPALLVSATRDFAASACSVMHRRLLAAGVDSRFVLFDGLGHAHHMAVNLPESRETFGLMARFFDEHLEK